MKYNSKILSLRSRALGSNKMIVGFPFNSTFTVASLLHHL